MMSVLICSAPAGAGPPPLVPFVAMLDGVRWKGGKAISRRKEDGGSFVSAGQGAIIRRERERERENERVWRSTKWYYMI